MSMKKLALLSSNHSHGGLNSTDMYPMPGTPPVPVHGVNIMLGGAMLSGIILVVFILCYCCHKTNRKAHTHFPSYWRDPGLSMEIYTVETQNCFDSDDYSTTETHRVLTPGPPPAYELVVPIIKENQSSKSTDESGLPTYESAVQLQGSVHYHV